MKKNFEDSKGITIVSLVITIILLLILAGISLQAFTGSGLFGQAIKSKEQTKLAELEEQMKLSITEMIANKNGEKITVDDYIKYLTEEENMNITDRYEENGKQIIEVDDKYVYEISDEDTYISIDKVGIKEDLSPKIVLESITDTTNSITVKVSTKRNEGGKIEYYIKAEDEEEYTLKETTTDTSYTYEELFQKQKYNVKIVAVAKNGLTAEVLVDKTLGSVPDLTEEDITFIYSVEGQKISKETWTNKEVTVTVSTTVKGYTLQTSKDGRNWSNLISQTFDENGDIYVALYDGTNYGGSATGNVRNIDTTEPVASISGTTTNSITFTGTDTASTIKNENASGIAGYIVQESSTAPSADDSRWTSYNGTSKTVSGLTQGKTYYVFVKDKAGNVSAAASKGTGSVTISKGNITSSVKSWNGTTATVQFTTSTGYYIQTKVGNGNWSANSATTGTATANTTSGTIVYARLTDSTGQYNNGDVASITPVLTYTIAFNSNGGSGSMSSLTSRSYGTSYTLTANSFTKSGYHFKNWNTKSDGSGTTYSNQASVSNLTITNGATVTLYAIWEQHSYTSSVTTAATCTTTGTRKYTCTSCGNSYTETIAALGHSGGAGATCTSAQTCTRCGVTLANALGHSAGAAATCTTAQTCKRCGVTLANALGHSAGAAATCTTKQTCTRCGVTLANALGHTGNEGGTVTQYTSCTNDGYRWYRCTRCHNDYGGTYKYENAWGHTGNEGGTVTQYASCTNDGYRYYRCTRCHSDYGGTYKYQNAKGHSVEEWKYDGGSKCHVFCRRCGAELASHTSVRGSSRNDKGEGRDYCKVCGTTMAVFDGW